MLDEGYKIPKRMQREAAATSIKKTDQQRGRYRIIKYKKNHLLLLKSRVEYLPTYIYGAPAFVAGCAYKLKLFTRCVCF